MYSSYSTLQYLFLLIVAVFICENGYFLCDFMPDLVLFNLGANCSFVSLAFSKNFSITSWMLDSLMLFEIVDDRMVRASKVLNFLYLCQEIYE